MTGSSRVPDAYEAEYMAGEGTVLYRDKSRAPWPLHAIFGSLALACVVSGFLIPEALVSLVLSGILTLLGWLLFAVLRVTVSQGHVNVQYGLFGPKIPVDAIESAEPTDYDWKQFGGWGIRMNRDGEWIYNMPGDGGRAVKVVWSKDGKRKVTYIGSLQADELAAQIGRARRALPPAEDAGALPPG